MHLSSTKLVFPWTLGQISNNSDHSGVFQPYQWIPGPFVTTMIIIVMLVFTLMPAVCSVCYHVYYWASSKDADSAVRNKDLILQGYRLQKINKMHVLGLGRHVGRKVYAICNLCIKDK